LTTARPNHLSGSFRLKDKLGTRSMARVKIKLEVAIAYAVGQLDRGFVADGRNGQFVAAFQTPSNYTALIDAARDITTR